MTQAEAYEAICYYTLSLGDVDFIHQHVVDAFAARPRPKVASLLA